MPTAAPPTTPLLRLNTETHTAPIRRIDVDDAGSRLLTVSDDKTARLWSILPGARLIRVFRPPIGDGNEGKLFAGALSPDGRIVAVGGWTGKAWDDSCSVYLFDAESGAMTGRLPGLPNVIHHLAFSRGGKRLAAGLGGGGVRVWEMADGREILADRDYGADVYGLAFANDGRLAATSEDGFLRLYDPDLKPVWKRRGGGTDPYGIAFSPDGARLVVGYYDVKRVELWSSAEGVPATPPDVAGGDDGNMGRVAWSADGRFLFAGGRWRKNGKKFIRRWAGGGNGPREDLPLTADDTVMDLKPLGSSGLLFGTTDPAFGGLDETGREIFVRPSALVDMRGKLGEALSVSADGLRLRFGLGAGGKRPVLFDLSARSLTDAPTAAGDLSPARVAGLPVTAWEDDDAPKLADRPLALNPFETSHSLAISPAGDRFVLGTEWSLRLFDSTGIQVWERPIPGAAWGVVVTGDGRMVVAACGDGTSRWFRLSDGAELLALFVLPADRRWVVWTPGGHYLASPGAEELIGFHVNRGADQAADFFPASTFRDRLNRPDVVARVLETLDEGGAIRLVDAASTNPSRSMSSGVGAELPPAVTIVTPVDGTVVRDMVEVAWRVRSPAGARIAAIHIRVGDIPMMTVKPGRKEGSATLALPAPDPADPDDELRIFVQAENKFGKSEPTEVRVRRAASANGARFKRVEKPKLFILAVGVRHHKNTAIDLTYPAKDARDFVHAMERQWGKLYRDVEVRLLTDETATRIEIIKGFDWLRREVEREDLAVLFLAGHGVEVDLGSRRGYCFVPHEAQLDALRATGVSKNDIRETLESISGKKLVFIDTCHAGHIARGHGERLEPVDTSSLLNEFAAADVGARVLMACSGTEEAEENATWGNGAFTGALVEGLLGAASDGDAITVEGLAKYVTDRVAKRTRGRQTPCFHKYKDAVDYPIAALIRP